MNTYKAVNINLTETQNEKAYFFRWNNQSGVVGKDMVQVMFGVTEQFLEANVCKSEYYSFKYKHKFVYIIEVTK